MLTSSLGNVSVNNTNRPRKLINMSHDVNTTADFGSVQPLGCHLMVPNSKKTVRSKSLMRLAPLVSPPFARIAQKRVDYFVPMSELTQNFTHMMAQEPVHRGTTTFVPSNVPSMSLAYLSSIVLCGAKMTVYDCSQADSNDVNSTYLYNIGTPSFTGMHPAVTDLPSSAQNIWTRFTTNQCMAYDAVSSDHTAFGIYGSTCVRISLKNLVFSGLTNNVVIPLSNCSVASFFDCSTSSLYMDTCGSIYDLDSVSLDAADVVLPVVVTDSGVDYHYFLAFRLSAFGKRVRKILLGCGYQINFNTDAVVSLMPLFAFYKAYFDTYGLWLYHSWETSFAYKLLWYSDQSITQYDFDSLYDDVRSNDFWQFFIKELGCCFVTAEQDFVSAHIRSTAVSPSMNGHGAGLGVDPNSGSYFAPPITNSQSSSEPSSVPTPGLSSVFAGSYINNAIHTQLDAEILKKLYKMTNRNTIAGRRVAELLRAQGLGAFVDEEKSYYIGSDEKFVNIDDVVSQSDTFDKATNEGSLLGEYGARGILGNQSDSLTYETNEYGYWVTLFCVYPKSGFSEQLDGTVLATSKWQFYNPEFDGVGYQFDKKLLVHGSQPFADFQASSGKLDESFGLVPRYSEWKVARNLMNGDFNRRGTRSRYLPYNLDKFIDVGERSSVLVAHGATYDQFRVTKCFKPTDMPIAGDVWRYITRYPWLGRFNRIFAYTGERQLAVSAASSIGLGAGWFELCDTFMLDDFLFQSIENEQYYAPMLPIEDSFETKEEGNDGAANGSMSKA